MSVLGNQGLYDLRLVKDVLAEKDAEIERLKVWLLKTCEVIESQGFSVALCTEDEDLGKWLKHEREATK